MVKKEKLIQRLKTKPKDFTWKELVTLLNYFGYEEDRGGKTSGSRVKFIKNPNIIRLHKPHPINELKQYQIKQIIEHLEQEGLL